MVLETPDAATNWTVSGGSLEASVTFESSDSPIASDAVDSVRKSRLILRPPSPDSGPCEITLSFKQKHEVRQVYVRSTARVYEIYYAPSVHSSNEYLCTVPCSSAAEDDLHSTDIEEDAHAYLKGSNGEVANEDDWVEVKASDSSLLDSGSTSLLKKTSVSRRSIKDFYEATAEITDAETCMSLTVRLLSLQSKGCVCVEGVYVFADPVESVDSEHPAVQVGNSAGSSLMAMLVPTLLHMSKSGAGRLQENHTFNTIEKREFQERGPKITDSNCILNGIRCNESNLQDVKLLANQHDEKSQEVNEATSGPTRFRIPEQVSDRAKNDLTSSQVGAIMEQLVSRMSRIEDLCMRFEEKMLKPINDMEARLQRVEEHVEVLAKNSQYSGFHSCPKFSAPAFSCAESNSSSIYNDGRDFPPGASEFEKWDMPSDKTSKSPDLSTCAQLLPSLVITAPEFSCSNDEEGYNASETYKDSPKEKPKRPLSVDDALAAALAGLSSATVQSLKCTERLVVTAPEFTSEIDEEDAPSNYSRTAIVAASDHISEGSDNEKPSQYVQTLKVTAPEYFSEGSSNENPSKYTQTLKVTAPEFASEEDGSADIVALHSIRKSEHVFSSDSSPIDRNKSNLDAIATSSDAAVVDRKRQETGVLDGVVDGGDPLFEGRTGCCILNASTDCPSGQTKSELTKDYQGKEETSKAEAINRTSEGSLPERADVHYHFHGNQAKDGSVGTCEVASASTSDVEGPDRDALRDVPQSSYASAIDFGLPFLEFVSSKNSSATFHLEALLSDVAEVDVEPSILRGSDDDVVTNSHLLLDLGDHDAEVPDVPGEPHDQFAHINQEMFASLI
ncbi:hypothetical protein RJ639_035445 [Escallonia herrerae]|uniref:Uncharacterized protein n=1 Tax=Escallonia herrerae TaxID=1293975 RepID=A0AA89B7B1_9ASTE|nr:hypothetical protein RJ639_035445 [Escallonia herrerae]